MEWTSIRGIYILKNANKLKFYHEFLYFPVVVISIESGFLHVSGVGCSCWDVFHLVFRSLLISVHVSNQKYLVGVVEQLPLTPLPFKIHGIILWLPHHTGPQKTQQDHTQLSITSILSSAPRPTLQWIYGTSAHSLQPVYLGALSSQFYSWFFSPP